MINKNYAKFFIEEEENINFNLIREIDFDDNKMDFLNVKYIVADKTFPEINRGFEESAKFTLAFDSENAKIYENREVWPRAFLIDESGDLMRPVEITGFKPEKIDLEVKNIKQKRLVLSEVFYPGWQVFINGKKGRIERYKGVFKSVFLTKGNHKVTFVYQPKLFYLGLLISLTGFLISGGLIWKEKRKKFSL